MELCKLWQIKFQLDYSNKGGKGEKWLKKEQLNFVFLEMLILLLIVLMKQRYIIRSSPQYEFTPLYASGEVFTDYTPIIQLGIQSLPGLKFNLNTNLDPIVVGASGMYELDLSDSSAVLTSLTFEIDSLNLINENPDGYLIIDIVYQGD